MSDTAWEVPAAAAGNPVFEAMGTCRAVRRFRAEPVPEELVEALLWAATRAPSPNNTQLWHFVVVTDPGVRQGIGDVVRRFLRWIDRMGPPADDHDARIRADARHLIEHLAEAPLLIVVCAEHRYPPEQPDEVYLWSAVSTASQNLLVAARSLGLATTLTMVQVADEGAVHELLRLPEHVRIGTIIPVGWPDRPFGPVRRRPVHEVVHRDGW